MVNKLKGPELNTLEKGKSEGPPGGLVAKSPLARAGNGFGPRSGEAAIRHRPTTTEAPPTRAPAPRDSIAARAELEKAGLQPRNPGRKTKCFLQKGRF